MLIKDVIFIVAKKSGAKCSCNVGVGIVSLILFAVGLWIIVNGFITQWNSPDTSNWWTVMLWYLVGFVVLVLGKMAKWKAHGGCQVHPQP